VDDNIGFGAAAGTLFVGGEGDLLTVDELGNAIVVDFVVVGTRVSS